MAKTPPPPDHLSEAARGWWKKIVFECGLVDSASLLVLQSGLESFDRASQARQLIDAEGVVVMDRFKQQKPHPAVTIERDSRSALILAMKSLGLREELED